MFWKVRVSDLTYPLVRSRGRYIALKALVVFFLAGDVDEAHWICRTRCAGRTWTTGDALAIGESLLCLATLRQLKVYHQLQVRKIYKSALGEEESMDFENNHNNVCSSCHVSTIISTRSGQICSAP